MKNNIEVTEFDTNGKKYLVKYDDEFFKHVVPGVHNEDFTFHGYNLIRFLEKLDSQETFIDLKEYDKSFVEKLMGEKTDNEGKPHKDYVNRFKFSPVNWKERNEYLNTYTEGYREGIRKGVEMAAERFDLMLKGAFK